MLATSAAHVFRHFVAASSLVLASVARAQAPADTTARVAIRTVAGGRPLSGVRIRAGDVSALTDSAGESVFRLPSGTTAIVASKLGLRPETTLVRIATRSDTTITIAMVPNAAAIGAVFVTSTRVERRLEDEPLRVEVLAGEDVAEKNEMHPGDLRTLFREMSGVRVQTTSPSLGAATVRVQGLRGRYTTVLSDGLPLYGTQPGGFGLVQLAPLDLRQVEVIKGAASALYGPSALGGVVNLVSRRASDTSQSVVNQTASGGTDAVGFFARQLSPTLGVTLTGGGHYQRVWDDDHDDWSDIPGVQRAEMRPRVFYQDSAGHSFMITAGGFAERRAGGPTARGLSLAGADSLATQHLDAGATGRWQASNAWVLATRLSANVLERRRLFAGATEREHLRTLFGELTVTGTTQRNTIVAGAAWQHEAYRNDDVPAFDETLRIPGVFLQHSFTPAGWVSSTVNARCDLSSRYGTICTPRVSVLARATQVFSVRASVGSGWAAPAVLNEETEIIGFTRASLPAPLSAERARTASLDVTATRGPVQLSGSLFANRVEHPVGLRSVRGDTTGKVEIVNAPGLMRVRGGEMFAVYNLEPVVATAYYAFTRSRDVSPQNGRERETPLTPRHEAGLDVALEEDESGAYLAAEIFYTGIQALDDNPFRSVSRPYTTLGLLGSKRFGNATIFLNVENLTGVRQSRVDPVMRSQPGEGGTRSVAAWAPLQGRTINTGIRYAF